MSKTHEERLEAADAWLQEQKNGPFRVFDGSEEIPCYYAEGVVEAYLDGDVVVDPSLDTDLCEGESDDFKRGHKAGFTLAIAERVHAGKVLVNRERLGEALSEAMSFLQGPPLAWTRAREAFFASLDTPLPSAEGAWSVCDKDATKDGFCKLHEWRKPPETEPDDPWKTHLDRRIAAVEKSGRSIGWLLDQATEAKERLAAVENLPKNDPESTQYARRDVMDDFANRVINRLAVLEEQVGVLMKYHLHHVVEPRVAKEAE